jgi:hypothetical protein
METAPQPRNQRQSESTAAIPATRIQNMDDKEKIGILLKAYEKHTRELLSLEESQQKLVGVIIGLFTVGAPVIAMAHNMDVGQRLALTVGAAVLSLWGYLFSRKRNHARSAIRRLIVNIETALRFYEDGAYLQGASLYPHAFQTAYPKPSFLGGLIYVALLQALVFIASLWLA